MDLSSALQPIGLSPMVLSGGDGSLSLQAILVKTTDTIVKVSLARPFPEFSREFSHLRRELEFLFYISGNGVWGNYMPIQNVIAGNST